MKKLLPLFLAVVLVFACLAPIAAAEGTPEGAPSREDMRGFGEIAVPSRDAWLDSYQTRYVFSTGGVGAYLFKAPKLDMELYFADVAEGTELTLLAEQNGFYLAKMPGHRLGWICVGQTAEDRALLDSVPDLSEGTWILNLGEGEKNTFAVKFEPKQRLATILRESDGARLETGWVLSGRRVLITERSFVWDGEQFVTWQEFWTPQGMKQLTLSRDTEGLYDKLAG